MTDFNRNPRSYALQLVEDGLISQDTLINILLNALSYDDVRDALDNNELSPRFIEAEEGESYFNDLEFDTRPSCEYNSGETNGFILSYN